MAAFKVEGLAEIEKQIEKIGQLNNDELISDMLKAGAEESRKCWVDGIRQYDHISTRIITEKNMITHVKATRPKKNKYGRLCFIYPAGKEDRPWGDVRHAAKAFFQHYGFNGKPGDHFVDPIERKSEQAAVPVMAKIFDKFIEKYNK